MTRKSNVRNITKFKRSVRAISPVVATLLLIAITVVASLVAYAWVTGYIGGQTTKTGNQIQLSSYSLINAGSLGNLLQIYVQNTGQGTVQLKQNGAVYANDTLVMILTYTDATGLHTPYSGQLISIGEGQTVALVVNYAFNPGDYVRIKVVTAGGTFMQASGAAPKGSSALTYLGPVAVFYVSSSNGLTAVFDASGSWDSGGTITSYAWTFGDGGSGNGVSPTHTYSASGTYVVTLTVTNNAGLIGSVSRSLTVSSTGGTNVAPTAAFTFSTNRLAVTFDASGSHDPDGSIASYAWTFGDGGSGTGVNPTHTYSADGTYAVWLTVTDNGGLFSGPVTQLVTVSSTGALDHFTVTGPNGVPIGTQTAGVGFGVTVTAIGSDGKTFTGFGGTVSLTAKNGVGSSVTISPTTLGVFAAGVWSSNSVSINTANTGNAITATDSVTGKTGTSNAFDVTHASGVSVSVSPATASIVAGGSQAFTAAATDTYGNTWDATSLVTWSIDSGAGGSVSAGGLATATKVGTWTVTAALTGASSGTAKLTVTAGALDHITASVNPVSVAAGSTSTGAAKAYDAQGNSWDVSALATWSIPAGGDGGSWTNNVYTAHTVGTYTVQASYSGQISTTQLTVTDGAVDHITASMNPVSVAAGSTSTGAATAFDAQGNSWDASALATWSIPAGGDGGSWATNVYTSHTAGTYTVQASYSSKTATTPLTVHAGLDHIVASMSPASITAGSTSTGTATAYDSFGNSWDVSTLASWSIPAGGDGGSWTSNVYTSRAAGMFTIEVAYQSIPTTTSLKVNAGAVDHITASMNPVSVAAGSTSTGTATAFDAQGNSWDVSALAGWSIPAGGDGGSWTTNLYTAHTVGTYTVAVAYSGKSTTTPLTVTDGAVISIAASMSPGSVTAGSTATGTATAHDAQGNSWDVSTLAIWSIPAGGDGGSWAINVYTSHAAGTYTVNAVYSGITGTAQLTVNDGALDHITASMSPASVASGLTSTGTATAYDALGNSWDVSALAGWSIPAGGDGGSWATNLYTAHTVGTYTVQVSYSGQTTTTPLTVTVGAVNHIVASMSPASIAAGLTSTGTATAFDAQGNSWDVSTLAIWSIPAGGDGGSWAINVYTSHAAGTYTVNAAYSGATGPAQLTVTVNSLAHFVFNNIGTQIAGTSFGITITAEDTVGNIVTNYAGTASFTDSSGTIYLVSSGVFTQGVWQGTVIIPTAFTNDIITATDSGTGATGQSNPFNVNSGAATKLKYTAGGAQSITVSTVSSVITVQLQDQYGDAVLAGTGGVTVNLATSTTTGTFSSNSGGTPKITSITIQSGQSSANFYYSDTASGQATLTASSGSLTRDTTTFTISANKLVFTTGATQSLAPGQTSTAIQISQETPTGGADYNILSTTTIQLSSSSPTGKFVNSGGTQIYSITVGILSYQSGTFYYVDTSPGTPTLTGYAGGFTSATTVFTIYTPTLNHFAFNTISSPQTAGKTFSITITAIDQKGSNLISYTGPNTLTASTGTISPTTTGTFTNGVWTGSVSLNTAGTGISISTSGGGATGQSNTFTVYTPALDHFTVTASSYTQTAGTAFTITVTAIDQQGNTFTGYTGTNTLTDTSGTITPTTTGTFAAGVCTVSNVKITKSGSTTISTSDGNSHTGTSNTFTVNPGALSQFIMSSIGTTQTAHTRFPVTITAEDQYGNIITNFGSTTTLSETDGGAGGTTNPTSIGGSFTNGVYNGNVYVTKAGTGVTLTVTSGSVSAKSNTFTVNPGALYQFGFSNIGSQHTGQPFAVTITAQDQDGNTVSYSGTQTLTAHSLGSGGTMTPSSVTFTNGVWANTVTITVSSTRSSVYLSITYNAYESDSNTFRVSNP